MLGVFRGIRVGRFLTIPLHLNWILPSRGRRKEWLQAFLALPNGIPSEVILSTGELDAGDRPVWFEGRGAETQSAFLTPIEDLLAKLGSSGSMCN
jgi:hypothetical protein